MTTATAGIAHRAIADTPIAIIDFETTGLSPGCDRVIEIAVLRVEPDGRAALVLDTLVNPCRPVAATEIHGITDKDVADAPIFGEITDALQDALHGCVLCAYNVYFDMRFLEFELANARVRHAPPYFCLMYMRPMLGLGKKCSLVKACAEHGIPYDTTHIAGHDVAASGKLLAQYLGHIKTKNIRTYGDLKKLAKYKFFETFTDSPFPKALKEGVYSTPIFKSRVGATQPAQTPPPLPKNPMALYWDELCIAVTDLDIDDQEVDNLVTLRKGLGLNANEIRFLHAHLFNTAITRYISDRSVTDDEALKLRRLKLCLRRLGWAPGD